MPDGKISMFSANGLNVDRAVNFYDINKDHQVSQSEFELTLGVAKDEVSLPAGVTRDQLNTQLQAWLDNPASAPADVRDQVKTLKAKIRMGAGQSVADLQLGSIPEALVNAAITASGGTGVLQHAITDTPIKRDDFINMMRARGMQPGEAAQLFDALNTDNTTVAGEQVLTKAEADAAFETVAHGGEVSQYDDAERLALASLGVKDVPFGNKTIKDYVAYPGLLGHGIYKIH